MKDGVFLDSDPNLKDSDGDGITDKQEITVFDIPYITDPMNKDTDEDGINDNLEIDLSMDPTNDDWNNNGLVDGSEYAVMYDNVDITSGYTWTTSGLWRRIVGHPMHSGETCWVYNDGSDYRPADGSSNSGTLESEIISLKDVSSASLNWFNWYETEYTPTTNGRYDLRIVEIYDGNQWNSEWSRNNYDDNVLNWKKETVSLDAYVGQDIYIRFRFDTVDDWDNSHPGWFIDDIAISAGNDHYYTDIFEYDMDGDSLEDVKEAINYRTDPRDDDTDDDGLKDNQEAIQGSYWFEGEDFVIEGYEKYVIHDSEALNGYVLGVGVDPIPIQTCYMVVGENVIDSYYDIYIRMRIPDDYPCVHYQVRESTTKIDDICIDIDSELYTWYMITDIHLGGDYYGWIWGHGAYIDAIYIIPAGQTASTGLIHSALYDDSDGDGLLDGWVDNNDDGMYWVDGDSNGEHNIGELLQGEILGEVIYGTNPMLRDTDGDSYDDKREIEYRTDPTLWDYMCLNSYSNDPNYEGDGIIYDIANNNENGASADIGYYPFRSDPNVNTREKLDALLCDDVLVIHGTGEITFDLNIPTLGSDHEEYRTNDNEQYVLTLNEFPRDYSGLPTLPEDDIEIAVFIDGILVIEDLIINRIGSGIAGLDNIIHLGLGELDDGHHEIEIRKISSDPDLRLKLMYTPEYKIQRLSGTLPTMDPEHFGFVPVPCIQKGTIYSLHDPNDFVGGDRSYEAPYWTISEMPMLGIDDVLTIPENRNKLFSISCYAPLIYDRWDEYNRWAPPFEWVQTYVQSHRICLEDLQMSLTEFTSNHPGADTATGMILNAGEMPDLFSNSQISPYTLAALGAGALALIPPLSIPLGIMSLIFAGAAMVDNIVDVGTVVDENPDLGNINDNEWAGFTGANIHFYDIYSGWNFVGDTYFSFNLIINAGPTSYNERSLEFTYEFETTYEHQNNPNHGNELSWSPHPHSFSPQTLDIDLIVKKDPSQE
jgi:hypothetical protein